MSAQERETANVGAGLWKGLGMWAWILFRISGLVLAAAVMLAARILFVLGGIRRRGGRSQHGA